MADEIKTPGADAENEYQPDLMTLETRTATRSPLR